MKNNFTWKLFKAIFSLYQEGETSQLAIKDVYFIDYHIHQTQWLKIEKKRICIIDNNFKSYFEEKYLSRFQQLEEFIISQNINSSDSLLVSDLESLINIFSSKNKIILNKDLTLKELSSLYFTNSKYLKEGDSLYKTICQILGIQQFSKEQQYLKVLHSIENPREILLCENENQLSKKRKKYTEIWVAGGKNISKLDYLPSSNLPIYYLCDWDYDGIQTYLNIKEKFLPQLLIIIPQNYEFIAKSITQTEHLSHWKRDLSLINEVTEVRKIIHFLIENNLWIEEESIDIFPAKF